MRLLIFPNDAPKRLNGDAPRCYKKMRESFSVHFCAALKL